MGKKKNHKAYKEDKEKIKNILKTHEELLQKNSSILSKRDDMISSKTFSLHIDEEYKKTKKPRLEKDESKEDIKPKKADVNTATTNLFEVKKYEAVSGEVNPDSDDSEHTLPKEVELSVKDRETDYLSQINPFKQNDVATTNKPIKNKVQEIIDPDITKEHDIDLKNLVLEYNPILQEIASLKEKFIVPKKTMPVNKKIIEFRRNLPIAQKEYEIIEMVKQSLVSVICGETGSGKSTQVPQYLAEAGFIDSGMIGVTQPRRLAAISLAKRVAYESGSKLSQLVGYQVRFEGSKLSDKTSVKFMTDGILLNEMMSDFTLSKYSIIILDEAHERKLPTDVLIGLLSRIVKLRAKLALKEYRNAKTFEDIKVHPLRFVIMSATLRIKDFVENKLLFNIPPPVVNIQVSRFPVNVFYSKITPDDYISEGIKKIRKIHMNLPKGGILVFLTGKEEVLEFCKRAHEELRYIRSIKNPDESKIFNGELNVEDLEQLPDAEMDDVSQDDEEKEYKTYESETYQIFPLYSKLSSIDQDKVFNSHPNKRLIIVSTNVAETSITIDGLKYIVDIGKEKNKYINPYNGLEKYCIEWISKASATQRKGRVGRTSTGYCYRIYSPAVYSRMFEFKDPEILHLSLNYTILQLAKIGIRKIASFPFPTNPGKDRIVKTIEYLLSIKALKKGDEANAYEITELGETLSYIPLEPKLSIILLSLNNGKLTRRNIAFWNIISSRNEF